ncbi:MAG: hypothetical protein E7335_02930 [Clostridiales bacterium]|nr:hypothetical protein [Clostridiales bacterium]
MKRIPAYIVPTTHWDREWVMTLGQFKVRLAHLMDKALDLVEKYPEYRFMLDGQSIVLDDYLDICPENRERLTAALKRGAIKAGPWYVLADQEMESYESTVRNLHYGFELVEKMGGKPMMEGYVPDSFGSIAALPQILNGFGIEYANFSRGNPGLEKLECRWSSKDGSNVACVAQGYGSGLFLSYPNIWYDIFSDVNMKFDIVDAVRVFLQEADKFLARSCAPAVYLSVGVDHMEPRESLLELVDYIQNHQDKYDLIFANTEDYMREVAKYPLPPYEGEMRGTPEKKDTFLNGTLSSRMDTKIANLACERMMQYHLDPLWAVVAETGLGKYPKGYLDKLWKGVIACHPHDSICGCSLDEVHADMLARMDDILRTGDYLRDEAIRILANSLEAGGPEGSVPIMVFKGGGVEGSCVVDSLVRIPRRFQFENYRLVDENGREVPCRAKWICNKNNDLESVYMTKTLMAQVLSKDSPENRPDRHVFTVVRLTFTAEDMPAAGWKCWYLLPGEQKAHAMETGANVLRNEFTKVTLNADGTFGICDLASGKKADGLNKLLDRLEAGNAYTHHEPENPEEVYGECVDGWKITSDAVESRAEATVRVGNRAEAVLSVSLFRGRPEARVKLTINNLVGDHCLRAQFPTGAKTVACDHYVRVDRPAYCEGEWLEHPFTDYLEMGDLTIFQGTVTAYEGDCLELLRCTSQLGPAAGANHPTPKGSMIGEIVHEYALSVGCEKQMAASANYHAGCVIEAGKATEDGIIKHAETLICLEGSNEMPVVSVKRAWDGEGTVVRAFNMGETVSVKASGSLVKEEVVRRCELSEVENARFNADSVEAKGFAPLTIRV